MATQPSSNWGVGVLQGTSINVKVTENIREAIWTKLMGNAFFNPVTALAGVTWGQLAASDAACSQGEGGGGP